MHGFASEIGIIDANGQLPGVRVQGGHTYAFQFYGQSVLHNHYSTAACHKQFAKLAYNAEEWNTIAEGGPDFYPSHYPMALLEPQPSVASMQQGQLTHEDCLHVYSLFLHHTVRHSVQASTVFTWLLLPCRG